MASIVLNPDKNILFLIAGLAARHGKHWCYPSQIWILKQLNVLYDHTMSIRTLNRHLRALVDMGYIQRVRRHTKCPLRGSLFRSTLYTLKSKAHQLLSRTKTAVEKFCGSKAAEESKSRVPCMAHNLRPSYQIIDTVPSPRLLEGGGKRSEAIEDAMKTLRARLKGN